MKILVHLGTNIENQNLIEEECDIRIMVELSDELELSESEINNIQKGNEEYKNVLKKIYYRLEDVFKGSLEIMDQLLETIKIAGEIGTLEKKVPQEQLQQLVSQIETSRKNIEIIIYVYDIIFNNVNFKDDVYNLLKENHELYSEVHLV